MKRANTLAAAIVGGCMASTTAFAAPSSTSAFHFGATNQLSDNYAEYLISFNGDSILDPGDLLIGLQTYESSEDLNPGTGGTNNIGSDTDELVAVFAQTYLGEVGDPGLTDPGLAVTAGILGASSVFGPVTPASTAAAVGSGQMSATLKAFLDAWAPGTVIAAYNDSAKDFTRLGADDIDATTAGDVGINDPGEYLAEEAGLDAAVAIAGLTATQTALFEIGFAGLPGEFFLADLSALDVALLQILNPPLEAGSLVAALNLTANFTGIIFDTVPCLFSTVQFCANGNILGVAGIVTPYDLFGNVDVVFKPQIPEPATTPLVLLGGTMLGLGLVSRRRRREA